MKNIKLAFLILLLFVTVGLFLFLGYQKRIINETKEAENWLLYKNKDLGISFKYPKQIMGEDMISFQKGHIVFLATTSSNVYVHREELISDNDINLLKSAQNLNKKYGSLNDKMWAILVSDVNSDSDLSNIIQKWPGFGDGCKLGNKTEISNKKGYFSINVQAVKPNDDFYSSSCPVNWVYNFEYAPEYKRSAIWDIGQEGQFYLDKCIDKDNKQVCFADEQIKNSFRFIDR